jgi:2-aminoethylphosphonate-pyruvate transaminase
MAVFSATAALSSTRILGANDRVRLGFIGVGNRGDQLIDAFLKQPDVEIVAVCDIHEPYCDFAASKARSNPKKFKDYRRLLEMRDLDAVVIGTPDHWHALQTVHACEAGKDVYVEKPLSLCIAEGRAMVEAVRKHQRVCQVGTQRRSTALCRQVAEFIRHGGIGKVTVARAFHIPLAEVAFAWGETVDLARVERVLDADPAIATVAVVHHETSTGLLNPVRQLGALCRARNLLFLVDAVASLGGEDLDVTRDNIDVCVSSANKCLHGISGVSFLCMSERAWDRIRDDEPRGYYLDIRKYRAYARLGQTPFTPAVPGLLALDRPLAETLEHGLGRKRLRYQALNEAIRAGLAGMGIDTFSATGSEAHVITIARVPEGIAFHDLYDEMKRRGYLIYECKAALANRYFQVANMGAMTMDDVQGFLAALRQVLLEHGCLVENRAAAHG